MTLYDKKFCDKLKGRYEGVAKYEQSLIRRLMETPGSQMRKDLETWFGRLPTKTQERFRNNLLSKNRKTCLESVHELVVFGLLTKLGYRPEYEKEIECKTPDWYVPAKGIIPNFIVEVYTKEPSNEMTSFDTERYLMGRIRQIAVPLSLYMDFSDFKGSVTKERNEDIAKDIEKWARQNPDNKSSFQTQGICITVNCRRRSSNFALVASVSGQHCRVIEEKHLRSGILKKIKKYRSIVDSLKIPFVVAVISDRIETGLTNEEFQEVMKGEKGLFASCPTVSGGLWTQRTDDGCGWQMRYFANLKATNPLPESAFPDHCRFA